MEDFVTGIDTKEAELDEDFLLSLFPEDFGFYMTPYYHQLVSIAFALQWKRGVAFFHDMGAGKTACAINTLRAKGITSNILVITVNAALKNWQNEFEMHADKEYRTKIISGTMAEKSSLLREDADVYIINFEGIFRRIRGLTQKEKKRMDGSDYVLEALDRDWEAIIIDESRMVAHPESIRSRVCMYLSSISNFRILLTGMPIAKSIEEIFSQYYCLDDGDQFMRTLLSFRQKYFVKIAKPTGFTERIPREGANSEVRKKMYKRAIRYSKEECADLPEKMFIKRYVELSGDQKEFYEKLKRDKYNYIVTKSNRLEVRDVLIKFMQITGGWLKAGDELKQFKSNAKLEELYYLMTEELHNEKIVIVASFVAEQRGIVKFLREKGYNVGEIIAGMSSVEIENIISKFNKERFPIVMSPKVGGRAINLTSCHYPIFYSQDFDFELQRQVEDRFHRYGQEFNVTYTKLTARETVDEKVIDVLSENQNLFDFVVDGKEIGSLI